MGPSYNRMPPPAAVVVTAARITYAKGGGVDLEFNECTMHPSGAITFGNTSEGWTRTFAAGVWSELATNTPTEE